MSEGSSAFLPSDSVSSCHEDTQKPDGKFYIILNWTKNSTKKMLSFVASFFFLFLFFFVFCLLCLKYAHLSCTLKTQIICSTIFIPSPQQFMSNQVNFIYLFTYLGPNHWLKGCAWFSRYYRGEKRSLMWELKDKSLSKITPRFLTVVLEARVKTSRVVTSLASGAQNEGWKIKIAKSLKGKNLHCSSLYSPRIWSILCTVFLREGSAISAMCILGCNRHCALVFITCV